MRTTIDLRRAGTLASVMTLAALGSFPGCADTGPEPTTQAGEPQPAEHTSAARQQSTVCVTIQRGVSGDIADTQISSNADPSHPSGNFGSGLAAITGAIGPGTRQVLIRPDLGAIPAGSAVSSATLTLQARTDSNPGGTGVRAHKVDVAWTEPVVSWTNFYGSPAPQYDATVAASSPSGPGAHTFDITALASEWVGGAANNGVLLEQSGFYYTNFYTSENPTASFRPKLDICYTPPPPAGPPPPIAQLTHNTSVLFRQSGNAALLGQSFTTVQAGTLASIELSLVWPGNGGSIKLDLYDANGTVVGHSGLSHQNQYQGYFLGPFPDPTIGQVNTFNFPDGGVPLVANAQYAFFIAASGSNTFHVFADTTNDFIYAGGTLLTCGGNVSTCAASVPWWNNAGSPPTPWPPSLSGGNNLWFQVNFQ